MSLSLKRRIERLEATIGGNEVTLEELVVWSYAEPPFDARNSEALRRIRATVRAVEAMQADGRKLGAGTESETGGFTRRGLTAQANARDRKRFPAPRKLGLPAAATMADANWRSCSRQASTIEEGRR